MGTIKITEYDQRQYQLMAAQISAFKQGTIGLRRIIDDLEGLLNALEFPELSLKKRFEHFWGRLEDERAVALDEGTRELGADALNRVREAVAEIEALVLKKTNRKAINE